MTNHPLAGLAAARRWIGTMLCSVVLASLGLAAIAAETDGATCGAVETPPAEIYAYLSHARACTTALPEGFTALEDDARAMLERVNAVRADHKLPPLSWHDGAAATARYHALDLLRRDYMDHESLEGLQPIDRFRRIDRRTLFGHTGENISFFQDFGQGLYSWHDMQDGLEDSAGHLGTMLNEHFTHAGIAIVRRGDRYKAVQFYFSHEGVLPAAIPPRADPGARFPLPATANGREVRGWMLKLPEGFEIAREFTSEVVLPDDSLGHLHLIVLRVEEGRTLLLLNGPIFDLE